MDELNDSVLERMAFDFHTRNNDPYEFLFKNNLRNFSGFYDNIDTIKGYNTWNIGSDYKPSIYQLNSLKQYIVYKFGGYSMSHYNFSSSGQLLYDEKWSYVYKDGTNILIDIVDINTNVSVVPRAVFGNDGELISCPDGNYNLVFHYDVINGKKRLVLVYVSNFLHEGIDVFIYDNNGKLRRTLVLKKYGGNLYRKVKYE